MGPQKIKKFLQIIGTVNPVDTAYRMKEIFATYPSDRRLVSRKYNNNKKKGILNEKYNNLANEMYRQFSKDEIQMPINT